MLPPLFRIETIIDACENNQLILTPNQRLRNKALQAWAMYKQASQEHDVWQEPRIYSLEQWFEYCWNILQGMAYPDSQATIASAEQERIIWESITLDCGLMQPEVIAKQANDALRSLDRWQLSIQGVNSHGDDDGIQLFTQWCSSFSTQLEKKKLITREQSYQIIGDAFVANNLVKEPIIHLVGFDDIPPLFKAQLTKAAININAVELQNFTPLSIYRTTYSDSETEMAAAAEWARALLKESVNDYKQGLRIGIIVPNLGQCRHQIERALINSFEGKSILADGPRYTLPFNISAGVPLAETPLFTDTFSLLKLVQNKWSVERLCQLLFSPFWGRHSEEIEDRCRLATRLQSLGVFEIDLSELRYHAEKLTQNSVNTDIIDNDSKPSEQQSLFNYFSSIHQDQLSHKKKLLASQWVDIFLQQLDLMNWPGERQPDSLEYQQTQLWYQLLESFAGLSNVLGSISAYDAIDQLQGMAKRQPFQAKVTDSPIQVLGILEGAGLHFTHCWVLGLHQQAWPPAPSPNPLLPLALQREHKMPHSSSIRELEFAKSLTQNYRHCAETIIFSSPDYDSENELPLLPSQLINDIPLVNDANVLKINDNKNSSEFSRYLDVLRQSRSVESIDCHKGPTVTGVDFNEQGELGGGTGILKAQSANPFDAFANYRLKARNPLPPVIGFSALERGNILHQALASIWHKLKDQATLTTTDIEQLEIIVTSAVKAEIELLRKRKLLHLGITLCELEIKRQTQLIMQWLEFEKGRPPFTVVSIEESFTVQIKDVILKLRLDRVDKLTDENGNNSYLIIDYKTGNSTISDWQGERPREPQLPFYLMTHHLKNRFNPMVGIGFAQINIHKQTLVGLHDGGHPIKGLRAIGDSRADLPNSWSEAKEYWQKILTDLLEDYLSGDCRVDYRDNNSLLFNREMIPLNRFYDK